ncbi:ExbD/TolR family protein [Psychromonas sp.]|uniref:ExbD/TolR family protein n=1 Tax=Psychromonas sp. TaxID=1884585 RepID=UPI003564659A
MKKSVRQIRIERHQARMKKTSKLSLVSLMDIFTILVFFLMVNASDVQVLQDNKELQLPESVSKEAARENLVLSVSESAILLQGKPIAKVADLKSSESTEIGRLTEELNYHSAKSPLSEKELEEGRGINIMADRNVPYSLLKSVMQTSASAGYTNISLAVEQVYGASDEQLIQAQRAMMEAGQ